MIRAIVVFWFLPIAFFWTWYFVSLYDLGFGLFFFSRELHDTVFSVYGATLGIEPSAIPGLVAKALLVDTILVLALVVLRRHRAIARFLSKRWLGQSTFAASDESLSKAP